MDSKNTELKNIIDEIIAVDDINISDIPCIDLYMDQITSLFETRLQTHKRYASDKVLTSTMINNYAKARILMPTRNKKYSRCHIMILRLIYSLKQILSINDIDYLFSAFGAIDDEIEKNKKIEEIYERFLDNIMEEKEIFSRNISEKLSEIEEEMRLPENSSDDRTELFLLVLSLVYKADMEKRLAEKIIDKYFFYEKKKHKTRLI